MFVNFTLINIAKILGLVFLLLGMVWLSDSVLKQGSISDIKIKISGQAKGRFISKNDVLNILTDNGKDPLIGAKFRIVDFLALEKKVQNNRLVATCEISRNFGGNLLVEITERYPIARIVALDNIGGNFNGLYVDQKGNFFPLSSQYTERVLLLTGQYLVGKKGLFLDQDQNILAFLNRIEDNQFWKTNITSIDIDKNQNINFLPLLGDFKVEFGQPNPEEIDFKLEKLKIFYQKIEPYKFEKYKKVAVNYKNQIVCQFKNASMADSLIQK